MLPRISLVERFGLRRALAGGFAVLLGLLALLASASFAWQRYTSTSVRGRVEVEAHAAELALRGVVALEKALRAESGPARRQIAEVRRYMEDVRDA